ncbi:cysteine peptidase family C39 domain-containing protein [Helcococcus kunzii]|uniref:ABC transporter domain-containing protein n=1 Tax=Helcococcus kunzii ATCC 51366 TaxID=883114 RepID=H3NM15_9FIRM|nr:cysteine peptidase family C39 domain-containing protein [Helcococcus kunzii]EHR35685.1 hypothetical protein HMPREF9709_00376 [Helcococcus kunzii ATCC 51366]
MKYKVIQQLNNYDCGASTVAMILENYYNIDTSLSHLNYLLGTDKAGTSFLSMIHVFKYFNIETEVYKLNEISTEIFNLFNYPIIIQTKTEKDAHFVVLFEYDSKKDMLIIGDPLYNKVKKIKTDTIIKTMSKYFLQIILDSFPKKISKKHSYLTNILKLVDRESKIYTSILWGLEIILFILGIIFAKMYTEYFDKLIYKDNIRLLVSSMLFFISLVFVQSIIRHKYAVLSIKLNNHIDKKLINLINQNLIIKNHGLIDVYNKADILTNLNNLSNLRELLLLMVLKLPFNLLNVSTTIILLILLNKYLSILIILLTIILLCIIYYSKEFYKNKIKNYYEKLEIYNKYIVEYLENIHIIKNYQYNNYISKKLSNKNEDKYKSYEKILIFDSFQRNIKTFLIMLFNILLFSLGVFLIINKKINLGVLLTYNSIVSNIYNPLLDLVTLQSIIENGKISYNKLIDIVLSIKTNNAKEVIYHKYTIENIDLENFCFSYDNINNVLNNLNLNINRNEKLAVMGSNGCGKTTFGKVLANYYPEKLNKNIKINNKPIVNYQGIDNKIIFINDKENIFSGTIIDNITLGRNIPINKIIEKSIQIGLHDRIQNLEKGYNTTLNSEDNILSLGQRQLIKILRATIQLHDVTIFDEITNGLDEQTKKKVILYLMSLPKIQIFLTHDIKLANECDNIYYIKQ